MEVPGPQEVPVLTGRRHTGAHTPSNHYLNQVPAIAGSALKKSNKRLRVIGSDLL